MKDFLPILSSIVLAVALFYQSYRIGDIQENTANQVSGFMERISPMINFPDTARRIVAPPLRSIKDFFYFTGKTKSHSKKLIDAYDYSPNMPEEIWYGYITQAESSAGGVYFLWSDQKVDRINTEICGWFLVAGNVLEYGHHPNAKDKTWAQMLFPVVRSSTKNKSL